MDDVEFCRAYFAATNVPISLIDNGAAVYSSIAEAISVTPKIHGATFSLEWCKNPVFCRYSPDIEYGLVPVLGTERAVVLGPIFNAPITDQLIRTYMAENALSPEYREAVQEFFCSTAKVTHMRFAWHMDVIHMFLNGKSADLDEILISHGKSIDEIMENYFHKRSVLLDEEEPHAPQRQEQQMFQLIRDGNVNGLDHLMRTGSEALGQGQLASSPLRQAKNTFIVTATKGCVLSLIPGGVAVEKAYHLMNLYIQECEQKQTLEEVYALLYSMLRDFCQCTGDAKIPNDVSADVYACANYIHSHTNEPISVEDVAACINRSTSYLVKRFKAEMGTTVGAYIMDCKLEQAKSLLLHSDRSLAEISSYLCFSNQSYFQNVFKKKFGVTPMAFRKHGKK